MRYLAVILALLALVGCTKKEDGAKADPSFKDDVLTIFTNSCMPCHDNSTRSGNYALTSYTTVMDTGSSAPGNVTASDSDTSKLYRKVKGIETPQMPQGGAPLDTAKMATIRNWINKGAKDN